MVTGSRFSAGKYSIFNQISPVLLLDLCYSAGNQRSILNMYSCIIFQSVNALTYTQLWEWEMWKRDVSSQSPWLITHCSVNIDWVGRLRFPQLTARSGSCWDFQGREACGITERMLLRRIADIFRINCRSPTEHGYYSHKTIIFECKI